MQQLFPHSFVFFLNIRVLSAFAAQKKKKKKPNKSSAKKQKKRSENVNFETEMKMFREAKICFQCIKVFAECRSARVCFLY